MVDENLIQYKKDLRKKIAKSFIENAKYCETVKKNLLKDSSLGEKIFTLLNRRIYKTVFGYFELKDEFPCTLVLKALLEKIPDSTLAMPITLPNDLCFKEIKHEGGIITSKFNTGKFNILEPEPESLTVFDTRLDYTGEKVLKHNSKALDLFPMLILTPGRAFSLNGARLGRGRGYYDRLFEKLNALATFTQAKPTIDIVGLAYSFQVLPDIPLEEHDYKVTKLITEKALTLKIPSV